ncbi:hypothetical protein SCHPADRAFT_994290 [Schizopora paradoxa]|uniref:MYND-type domain-containing protein n=1 Tax=Schizopora paradoxa TaxID=27342 RepID=A0A0H2SKM0_9AGAM|nr:hypothetical protein SCHPADRAFT_994290 [Schizopora paradoxa]
MSRFTIGPPWSSETTKQHIAAARAGSSEDLSTIAMSIHRINPEHELEIAEVLCTAFEVPDGFDPLEPLPDSLKSQYEQVKACIHGFVAVGGLLAKRNDLAFKAFLSVAWPNILKWAHYYFVDHSNSTETQTFQGREKKFLNCKAMGILSSLFAIFGSIERGFSNPSYRDNTLTLLAKLWLKVVPDLDPEMCTFGGNFEIMRTMRLALADVSASPTWFLSSAREIILREAKNQASMVAKVAFTVLRDFKSFQSDDLNQKFVLDSLFVICYLLGSDKPGEPTSVFHRAFIDQRLVKISMRTLKYFSTSPNNALEYSQLIAGTCFKVVFSTLEAKPAYILAPQILKHGLLDRVADYVACFCSKRKTPLDPTSVHVLKMLLGRMLPNLLVHYPVISSAVEATNSLIRSKKITHLTSGIFSTEWKIFMDILLERATIKALYDLELKKKDHLMCHNCGLSSNSSNKKLSACSGCKLALYCSPECQKEAWNSETLNHRLECKALMELTSESDKYFNLHSTYFIPHLFGYDFNRHLPGIQKLIAESPEFLAAGSDLAYGISYIKDDQEPEKEIFLFLRSKIGDEERFGTVDSPEIHAEKLQHVIKRSEVLDSLGSQMVYVKYLRGGSRAETVFSNSPKAVFEMPSNAILRPTMGKTNPRRRKARDEKGRELETLWDLIDSTMFAALKEDEVAHRDVPKETDEQVTVFDRIARLAKQSVELMDIGMAISLT